MCIAYRLKWYEAAPCVHTGRATAALWGPLVLKTGMEVRLYRLHVPATWRWEQLWEPPFSPFRIAPMQQRPASGWNRLVATPSPFRKENSGRDFDKSQQRALGVIRSVVSTFAEGFWLLRWIPPPVERRPFFFFNIDNFWLCWVLVAAGSSSLVARAGATLVAVCRLLIAVASLFAEYGL